ncbi:MAG: hypothetical protein RL357_1680 [Pseudomonadota bacterium]
MDGVVGDGLVGPQPRRGQRVATDVQRWCLGLLGQRHQVGRVQIGTHGQQRAKAHLALQFMSAFCGGWRHVCRAPSIGRAAPDMGPPSHSSHQHTCGTPVLGACSAFAGSRFSRARLNAHALRGLGLDNQPV